MARTATLPRPKAQSITRDFCEYAPLALGKLDAGKSRVDRANKIIYRVKMVGASSPNTHDVQGAEGTDYLFEAVQRAASMYEGAQAFKGHPPRANPDEDRDPDEVLGIYHDPTPARDPENPELGELFGDLHLIPSHPMTESLLDAAEKETLLGAYSLSHNARGDGELRGNRYVVTNIRKVRSCDVVSKGATTKNFFESRNMATKTTLEKVLLGAKSFPAKTKAVLLEMGDMMSAPVDEPPAEPTEDDWRDHLMNACAVLVKSDDPEAHAKAKKIMAMMAPEKAEEIEESEEEPAEKKDEKKAEKEDEKEYKESLAETKELFDILIPGHKSTTNLIGGIAKLRGKERMAAIRELKESLGTAPAKPGSKPPPGAPRGTNGARPLLETPSATNAFDDLLTVPLG